MNAKETLYRYALENLNHLHDGDEVFESVCHEVVKYSLPSYQFTKPSGGNGPRDGGRDGFDANKNCRMACAIRVDYEKKLDEEIGKCKQESELFFFSNQKIPETQKIKLEEKYKSKIKLKIFSWADLSESIVKISKSFEFREIHAQIDDLLDIQKITYDYDCPNFNIKPQKVECEGDVYKSKIIVKQQEGSSYRTFCGINPLISYFDFAFHGKKDFSEVQNCYLKGVFGIGKTTSIKLLYNSFLTETEKEWAKSFFPLYYSVRNYPEQQIKIPSTDNNFICFLDGIDEISDEKQLKLLRTISNYINSDNVRFVLSGRDGGFNSDTESFFGDKIPIIKIIPYLDPDDLELVQLQNKLKNTPLERMVLLPIFRSVLSREKNICDLTPKKLYDLVVLDPLKKDCLKYNQSIDCVDSDERESFFNKVVNEFSYFCYEAFCCGQSSFSRDEIKKYFSKDTFKYIYKSTLLDVQSPKSISVHNFFYYEYFVANYLADKYDKIRSALMGDDGIDSKQSNILRIIFDISNGPLSLCKRISEQTSELSGYSLLLKVKYSLTAKERFDLYMKIYKYFCKKGRLIYYVSFNNQNPFLKDIDSLAEELYELLPEQYYTKAVDKLLSDVKNNIENLEEYRVVAISNAIVLLGTWGSEIWKSDQQEKLKKYSGMLLNFLLENESQSEILKGFLSNSIVLNWYKTYGWTTGWKGSDWDNFLKQSFPNTLGYGEFKDDKEFHFQLEIFNNFCDDNYIKQLAKPLCIETMKKIWNDVSIAAIIPNEIDDDYKTPLIHTDSDISLFHIILEKEEFLSANDIIDIIDDLIHSHINLRSQNYEFGRIKETICKTLLAHSDVISVEKTDKIYDIIAYAMDDSTDIYFFDIESYLKLLPDQIKQLLLEKIIKNFNDLKWKQDWAFSSLLSSLLDMNNASANAFMESIQQIAPKEFIHLLIQKTYNDSRKTGLLYKLVKPVYESTFSTKIQKDAEREKLISKIEHEHAKKQLEEISLLTSSSAILKEINAIESFLKKHNTDGVENYHLFDLEYETIYGGIRNDLNLKAKHTPIYSDFVVKFLQNIQWRGSFAKLFEDARSLVNDWFSENKKYWIGFFNCFILSHSDEEVKKIISENQSLKNRILTSMAEDISDLQKCLDIQQIVTLTRPNCITPFVRYVHILLDDKIPEYVEKKRLITVIAYRSTFLATSAFYKNKGLWGNCETSFDWLHNIVGYEYSEIVQNAIEIYPKIKDNFVKAQVLSELIKHFDCQKRKITSIVLKETKNALANDGQPRELNYGPLQHFWTSADEKYLNKIIEWIPFEKYDQRHDNPCLREVINYTLKYISTEKKLELIEKYKDCQDDEMRELLRRLGSKEEILRKISEYLQGGKVDSNFGYDHAYLFGFIKQDDSIFRAYLKLFKYSMEKQSERRSALFTIAKKGIKEHITLDLFKSLKSVVNKQIKERQKAGLYVDGLYDFIDEMEQVAYSK